MEKSDLYGPISCTRYTKQQDAQFLTLILCTRSFPDP